MTGVPERSAAEAFSALLGELRTTLAFMAGCGCSGFGVPEAAAEKQNPGGRETLEGIRADLGDCRRCGLCRSRNRIVFGGGSPAARLVFVGEGPGYDEDRSGEPFVGRAGQLLNRIIAAMNLTREAVYICNIVKCRPPDNRNPLPEEVERCMPFLERQIAAVAPDVICTLGAVATRALLKTGAPISRLRGRFHDYRGIRVMPTYHPAFLLRYPEKKRETWADIQMIMGVIEKI
jgi:DNA polymerase